MKRTYIYITILSLFIMQGCGNNKNTMQNSESLNSEGLLNIQLNNGEKWTANKETIEGIQNMKRIVSSSSFILETDSLKESLQHEIDLIFLKCNMTGKAHEQLHHYLLPLREKVNELTIDEKSSIGEIEIYLNEFSKYFQ